MAILIVGACVFAPLIAPHDPTHTYRELMPLNGTALPPSGMFPLGTDSQGHDYLSVLLYAGRATLLIGLGANLIATAMGVLVGLVAGFVRSVRLRLPFGRSISVPVETPLMRLTDVGLAFPVLLLAIATTSIFGKSVWLVLLVIALVLWTTTARLVYGRVRAVRSADFVVAARALGCGDRRILRRHILPHVMPVVLVYAALGIASTILFEAALSFVGAGAPRSDPTWGFLLSQNAGSYRSDLRLPLLPGIAITLAVLAFTLLGDALRDANDPRSWGR